MKFVFLLVFLISEFFTFFVSLINLKYSYKASLPEEVKEDINEEEFIRSKFYLKDKTKLSQTKKLLKIVVMSVFLFWIFPFLEDFTSTMDFGYITQGLVFFGIYGIINYLIDIPFSVHNTFNIEEKYNFNKSDSKTFILDNIKSIAIGVIIGAAIISIVLFIINNINNWWIYVAGIIVIFQILSLWIYPNFIMPLFNKFTPLEDEDLKKDLTEIAKRSGFEVNKIFVMDASKRTKHSNAFFTGFGKTKKIVLYDTLLENHTNDEIKSIFAHEAGHYYHKHILKMFFTSSLLLIASTLVMYFIIDSPLINSFGIDEIYTRLMYSFIFTESIFTFVQFSINSLSRKNEIEADNYTKYFETSESLISALKKLSKKNLSNLTPHPFYSKLHYSHPTVIERINNLKGNAGYYS